MAETLSAAPDRTGTSAVERFARRMRDDLDEPLRVLADACLTDGARLGPDVSSAAAAIVEYMRSLESHLASSDDDGRRGPGPRLTMALASELSFIARHMDAPLPAPAVERLQPRVRRAARLATLWLTPYAESETTTTGPESEITVAWKEQRAFSTHAPAPRGAAEDASVPAAPGSPASAATDPSPADAQDDGLRGNGARGDGTLGAAAAAEAPGRPAHAGDPLDAFAVVRDRLQELRERADVLEERALLQDRYWRFATHELRNAAHALVLGLERISTTEAGGAPWMQPLVRAAESVVRRSEEALDERRVNRGVFDVHPQAIDLVEVALAALENARDLAVRSDVRLVTERLPVGHPVWAMADPGRVEQILHNLLRNAIQAAPPGGFVLIECLLQEGAAAVIVADSGPGVPEDAPARLFSMDTDTRPGSGFGLGLPLSRHLARAMGGDVELLPAQPGFGGRFRLRLPRGHE